MYIHTPPLVIVISYTQRWSFKKLDKENLELNHPVKNKNKNDFLKMYYLS